MEGRQRKKDVDALDDLFGIHFLNANGRYEPGHLASADHKKLSADALAQVQLLAIWLPADVRLLWLLGEMANVQGDAKTAAAIFDGCVTEFNSRSADLRQHRQLTRAVAEEQAKQKGAEAHAGAEANSEAHLAAWRPRSKRPLATRQDHADLPAVVASGVNYLPWTVLADTLVERDFHPTFPHYLLDLDGKTVSLTGFIQPLNEDLELNSFMLIEYPIGCWYCEMPELNSIVFVELTAGKTFTHTHAGQGDGNLDSEQDRSRKLSLHARRSEGDGGGLTPCRQKEKHGTHGGSISRSTQTGRGTALFGTGKTGLCQSAVLWPFHFVAAFSLSPNKARRARPSRADDGRGAPVC